MVATLSTTEKRTGERPQVFVVSNDIVPGLGLPVAAPGLRAFGLSEGLKAHGFRVKTLLMRDFVERQWRRVPRAVPPPSPAGVELVRYRHLPAYLEANAPAVVVLINSNQVDRLRPREGLTFVLDFFAPKVLEALYQFGPEYPAEQLEALRRRKIEAIRLADAFLVNGEKKVPYFIGWMLQAGRDIRKLPLKVVNMSVPLAFGPGSGGAGVRFALAGYLQAWSTLGAWVEPFLARLDRPGVSLEMLVAWHWSRTDWSHASSGALRRLAEHPSVRSHAAMTFSRFQEFLAGVDVTVDLFEWNLEREYAMVTRAVISLACGVPVVHPPFTEVSRMISAYDAGWLVDPSDAGAVGRTFDRIIGSPEEVRRKRENARRLARELIDPKVAVGPLVEAIREIHSADTRLGEVRPGEAS